MDRFGSSHEFSLKALRLFTLLIVILAPPVSSQKIDTLFYHGFGKVLLYWPQEDPNEMVLFISGDGGWNKRVIEMARGLTSERALVAGINIQPYLNTLRHNNSGCLYPASDFENLSKYIQKSKHFKSYSIPVIIGYSSGATLVYGIAAQSPENTFKGAIGLGFCPNLDLPKCFCRGSGLTSHLQSHGKSLWLHPSKHMTTPFYALQGMADQVCNYSSTKKFIDSTNMGTLVSLPNVGHGFSVKSNWWPQFIQAYNTILQHHEDKTSRNKAFLETGRMPLPPGAKSLPLHITVSHTSVKKAAAFLISGDGGWTDFDQKIANALANNGIPSVGLDALNYFWNKKTPQITASQIAPILEHYMQEWKVDKIVLVGYSFGADLMPFILGEFEPDLQKKVSGLVLLSPSEKADFEIHLEDMLLGGGAGADTYDVMKALHSLESRYPIVCIFGQDEKTQIPVTLKGSHIRFIITEGGHHFDQSFNMIASETGRLLEKNPAGPQK